jgi:hypothetical protein
VMDFMIFKFKSPDPQVRAWAYLALTFMN